MSLVGRRYLAALAFGCALASVSVPDSARAQAGENIGDRRSDLDDLKKRIRELQQEMSRTEVSRSGAAKSLAGAVAGVKEVDNKLVAMPAK